MAFCAQQPRWCAQMPRQFRPFQVSSPSPKSEPIAPGRSSGCFASSFASGFAFLLPFAVTFCFRQSCSASNCPIGQPLADHAAQQDFGALKIFDGGGAPNLLILNVASASGVFPAARRASVAGPALAIMLFNFHLCKLILLFSRSQAAPALVWGGAYHLAQRRLIRDLAEQCRIQECQIIITTHSPYVIDELPLEARICILRSSKGHKASIKKMESNSYCPRALDGVKCQGLCRTP